MALSRLTQSTLRAFSLIEVLTVLSIISVVAGATMPALRGVTSSKNLQTGARLMAGWLNVARSEAISRHTIVRFAVAREWPGKSDANLRRVSLWAWDADLESFNIITPWQELPAGVALEPALPEYLRTGSYAAEDRSAIRGDDVLGKESPEAEFGAESQGVTVRARFVDFTAAGRARFPGGDARQAIFVVTPGAVNSDGSILHTTNAEGHSANWAQINVDTFTGRVRVYQP